MLDGVIQRRGAKMFDIEWYKRIAQTAEKGKFDMIFFADLLHLIYPSRAAAGMLDPVSLLSALSVVTDKIGLTRQRSRRPITSHSMPRAV